MTPLAVVAGLALAASPARLALHPLGGGEGGVPEARVRAFEQSLSSALEERGLPTTRAAPCAPPGAGCLMERAAALGAEAIASGTLVQLPNGCEVRLEVLRAGTAERLARFVAEVEQPELLADAATRAADALMVQLSGKLFPARAGTGAPPPRQELAPRAAPSPPPALQHPTAAARPSVPGWYWAPGAAGLALAAAGAVALFTSRDPEPGPVRALGVAGVGLGAAGVLASGALLAFAPRPEGARASAWLGPEGAGVSLAWTLP